MIRVMIEVVDNGVTSRSEHSDEYDHCGARLGELLAYTLHSVSKIIAGGLDVVVKSVDDELFELVEDYVPIGSDESDRGQ